MGNWPKYLKFTKLNVETAYYFCDLRHFVILLTELGFSTPLMTQIMSKSVLLKRIPSQAHLPCHCSRV